MLVAMSRLGLLNGNRWMLQLPDRDRSGCPGVRANCSLHATVGGALSETIAMVVPCTVPRLSWQSCRLQSGEAMAVLVQY